MAADAPKPEQPQINLITPPSFQTDIFPDQLARILDAVDIACLRVSLATKNIDDQGLAADICRDIAHQRDVAVVIDNHLLLVERHGLDGVHLTDGARSVRKARKDLGQDAIIGAFCGTSRHEGMNAGEAGADYVALGPVGETGLGDGSRVDWDLFQWWSEVIEVPVIAEGALTPDLIERFGPVTDHFAIGEEIWHAEDPLQALKALIAPLG